MSDARLTEPMTQARDAAGPFPSAEARSWACLVATALSMLPFLLVRHYPLLDWPNHLGRWEVHRRLPSSPALQAMYEWRWAVIPNLAMDVLVWPVQALLETEAAGNLVLAMGMLTLLVGTVLLDRALHGERWGLSVFGGLLLFNGALRMGFVNYMVGVGFAVLAFSLWVRARPGWTVARAVGFVVVGAVLLLSHLFAFGLYAVCVAGYEATLAWERVRVGGRWRWPGLMAALGPGVGMALVLAAPLLLLAMSPTAEQAGGTRWSTLQWKLEALLAPVFFSQPAVELALYGVMGLLVAAGLVTGRLVLHRRMVLAAVVFGALVLAMPRTLFGSNYADFRLLCGASSFMLAGLSYRPRSGPALGWVGVGLGLLLLVRVGSIGAEWVAVQPMLDEYARALEPVPPGAKVLVLLGTRGSASADRRPPLEHIGVLAAARQEAFVPTMFNGPAQTVVMRPEYKPLERDTPGVQFARDLPQYDFVLLMDRPAFTIPEGVSLRPIGEGLSYVLAVVERAP